MSDTPFDADHLEGELYALSECLARRDPEAQEHGFLGGEFGYGQDFKNEVFEMHPYTERCSCGFEEEIEKCKLKGKAREEWIRSRSCAPDCTYVRPNFRYFKTGLEVTWYKYLGRDITVNQEISRLEFRKIINECIESAK